jgi:hypothetical protein
MRYIKLFFIALLLPVISHAQDISIKEGPVKMGKTKLSGFTASYSHTKDVAVNAMEGKITAAGIRRSSHKKGFSIYRGVAWQAINNNKGDYYYKVKGKKSHTKLYFVASKGYDNYITSTSDAEIAGNIKKFLQDLDAQMTLNEKIGAKEAELKQVQQKNAVLTEQIDRNNAEELKKQKELKTMKVVRPTYDK